MLSFDFEDSIGYWLICASHAYQRVLNEELAPEGITYRQCQVLGCLALTGGLSQTELADRMRIEPPTLVGILDRMERDGWIRRDASPIDRRKKLIRALPAATPVWQKIVECGERVRAKALHGLSAEEVETLKRLMRRMHDNLTPSEPAPAENAALVGERPA